MQEATQTAAAPQDAALPPPQRPNPASFPAGSMQRRFTVHYWKDAAPRKGNEAPPTTGQGQHQYLYEHGNGLFVVGMAKEHVAIQACVSNGLGISRVEFLPSSPPSEAAAAAGSVVPSPQGEGQEEEEEEEDGQPAKEEAGTTPIPTATATNAAVSARMKEGKVTTGPRGKKNKKGGGKSVHVRRDTVLAHVVLSDGQVFPVYAGVHGQLLELNETLMTDPGLLLRQPENNGFLAIIQPPRFSNTPPNLGHLVSHEAFHSKA